MRTIKTLIFALCTAAVAVPAASETTYPSRPIKIIVGSGAGSGIDMQVRQFAQQFAQELGETVVVENRAGAGSQLAYEVASRAVPDGYTLFAGTNANFIHQYMRPSSKIDPLKDMAPVSLLFRMASVLVVAADSPAEDVAGLVQWAKREPGRLNYGSGGVGAASHLLAAAIVDRNKLDVEHIPVRNLTTDLGAMLMRKDIHFALPVTSLAALQIDQGTVRALAVTSAKRLKQWPDVPTLAESFKDNRYVIDSWAGLFAPAGTPAHIVDVLHGAAVRAVESAAHLVSAETFLTVAESSPSPESFQAFLRAESHKWRDIVRESGISPE